MWGGAGKDFPMKQGDKYMKLVMLVLALMVASYVLYSMLGGLASRVPTVQAVLFSANEGVTAQGVVVREEKVIPADFGLNMPTKREGERVAIGEEVAVSLKSDQARQTQQQLKQKEQELKHLQHALSYQTQLADSNAVTQQLGLELAAFSSSIAGEELNLARQTGENIKALVLRQSLGGETRENLENQVTEEEKELAALRQQATAGTTPVKVSQAGYYSQVTDGYETVLKPQILETCTVQQFQSAVDGGGKEPGGNTAGKLITSSAWYCAAQVEPEHLEGIRKGDKIKVFLNIEGGMELEMEAFRVDKQEGFLVLTSNQYLSHVSALRNLEANVIFHSYEGLRVPKEAICYDEQSGQAGVYVLINRKAQWKPVELMYDVTDAYIAVLDQSETGNLWPGDMILTETKGLYDGKVVG